MTLLENDVKISVVTGDALLEPCDVLIVKWAQAPYGVDRAVLGALQQGGVLPENPPLPEPGRSWTVRTGGSIAAAEVLFMGVPRLRDFLYPQIRAFGPQALAVLAHQRPQTTTIALTVHGPGYGLDEPASFEALLDGLLLAIQSGDRPEALREVRIVERTEGRSHRLRAFLDTRGVQRGEEIRRERRTHEPAPSLAGHPTVFVAMPFADDFIDVYQLGIAETLHARELKVERIDHVSFTGDIVAEIRRRISRSKLVIADLTGANPNVYLEVGFAWGRGVPTLLIARKGNATEQELRFDTRGQRCLEYTSIVNLRDVLNAELTALPVV